jgi:hypothetical protein
MVAFDNLKPGILGQLQGHPIPRPQLLQLRDHTLRDHRGDFPQQAVHGVLQNVQLVLDREVYEIGVDQDPVGRAQGRVVFEEHVRGLLFTGIKRGDTFLLFGPSLGCPLSPFFCFVRPVFLYFFLFWGLWGSLVFSRRQIFWLLFIYPCIL